MADDKLQVLLDINDSIDPNGEPGSISAVNHRRVLRDVLYKAGKYSGFQYRLSGTSPTIDESTQVGRAYIDEVPMNTETAFNIRCQKRTFDLNDLKLVLDNMVAESIIHIKDFEGRSFILIYQSYAEYTDPEDNEVYYDISVKGVADNSSFVFSNVTTSFFNFIQKVNTEGNNVSVEARSTITDPETGQLILNSENLNNFEYWNGTDWIGFDSGFELASGNSGTIDQTKDLVRSGKTSFGGDDPTRQVEVIGEFWNKEIIDGVGSTVVSTGNNVGVDEGIPAGALTGIETTFKDETSGDRAGAFVGKSNVPGVSDLTAILGINKGANPVEPDEYGRVSVFRAAGGIEHIVLDLEVKNGATDSHKFRIRSGRWETNTPALISAYGDGDLQEGDNYEGGANIGTVTLGAPTYALGVTSIGHIIEIPLQNNGIIYKEIDLTSAQISSLNSSPTVLVDGVVGKFIDIISLSILYKGDGETAWDYNGGNGFLYFMGENRTSFSNALFYINGALDNTGDNGLGLIERTDGTARILRDGEGFVVRTLSADPINGTVGVKFLVTYKYVNL